MDLRGRPAAVGGKLGRMKQGLAKKFEGLKNKREEQQDTELSDMSNSRTRPTAPVFLPVPGTMPPLPTFHRPTPSQGSTYGQRPQRTTGSLDVGQPHRPPQTPRPDSRGLPEIRDVGNLLQPPRRRGYTVVGLCGGDDKPQETPPLPQDWSQDHDRAICFMDSMGAYPLEMAAKIKEYFPDTKGVLTAAMVDKRLRQLDQIAEIDYWRSEDVVKRARAGVTGTPQRTDSAGAKKENQRVGGGDLPLRMGPASNAARPSNSSLRGLSLSQSDSNILRGMEIAEPPSTPTRPAITAETRRRDAAIRSSRSSRSRTNIRLDSMSSML